MGRRRGRRLLRQRPGLGRRRRLRRRGRALVDVHAALAGTGRLAGALAERAQDELAGALGRHLGAVPERRIAELAATPLRGPFLDALFWGMPRVLGRSHAERIAESVRFRVTSPHGDEPDEYVLHYRPGRWRCTRDPDARTELTITASAPDLLALASGRATPMRLYAAGRLRVRGNPRVAVRLLAIMRAELAPTPSFDPT